MYCLNELPTTRNRRYRPRRVTQNCRKGDLARLSDLRQVRRPPTSASPLEYGVVRCGVHTFTLHSRLIASNAERLYSVWTVIIPTSP